MKLKVNASIFIIVWAFHLSLCGGCASRETEIVIDYAPTEPGLLSKKKPSVVCLQVVDQRPENQRDNIGVRRKTLFGAPHGRVVSKIPEVQVVHNALKAELERSGHRVLGPGQGSAEITLNVSLTQFLLDSKAAEVVYIEVVGSIRADVVASASTKNISQLSFRVESSYRDYVQMGWAAYTTALGLLSDLFIRTPKDEIEKVVNGTLAEFVRCFCEEPKLRQVFI